MLVVYAMWAVLGWFVFSFGMETYDLLGPGSEVQFARDWAVVRACAARREEALAVNIPS